jgi:hypothetical protein
VVFMRALCAVSQEELEAGSSSMASAVTSSTAAGGSAGLSSPAAGEDCTPAVSITAYAQGSLSVLGYVFFSYVVS